MPRHASPGNEPRIITGIITAVRSTCHLCSWAWNEQKGAMAIKRPSAACKDAEHRSLLTEAYEPLAAWLQAS